MLRFVSSILSLVAPALILGLCFVTGASAHPHVWVAVKGEVVYGAEGRVLGVRHAWSFDKKYSAYAVQGLDRNKDGKVTPDELEELVKLNIDTLSDKEYLYFTTVKANGVKQEFGTPTEARGEFADGVLTLSFFLPLKTPAKADKALLVEVYDPTYFVKYEIAEGDDAMRLVGAQQGCVLKVTRPPPPEAGAQQNLSESFFSALTASSNFGSQFVNKVIVACP